MTMRVPAKADIVAWLSRALLLLPAFVLVVLGAPRFGAGLGEAGTFPVPYYIATATPAPRAAYLATAESLSGASTADGESQIARAEALSLGGASAGDVRTILEPAMTRAPSSARGWTLLAESALTSDRALSARAVAMALQLSPLDYWLGGRRARAGAQVWAELAPDAREALLRQTRFLWSESTQHDEFRPLLTTPGGPELVTRALAGDLDALRGINRQAGWEYYRDAIYPR